MLATVTALSVGPARGAEAVGMGDPDVAYDRALAEAEAGNLSGAVTALNKVLQDNPNHAGALLDIALFECRLGRRDEKDRALRSLRRLGEVEPLPSVIEDIVARLEEQNCGKSLLPQGGRVVLRGSLGYAQNLNYGSSLTSIFLPNVGTLRLSDQLLPRSSPYLGLELSWQQALSGKMAGHQASTLLQVGSQNYSEASDFSTRYADAALIAEGRFGNVGALHSLAYSNLQMGRNPYLQTLAFRTQWYRLYLDNRLRLGAAFGYTRLAYEQAIFDAEVYEPSLHAETVVPGWGVLRGEWSWIQDSADDNRPGGDRRGHSLGAIATVPVFRDKVLEVRARATRLRDAEPYFPLLFGSARRDYTLYTIATAGIWQFTSEQKLRLEWRYQRQDDSIELFSYNAHNFALTWEYLFR